MALTFHQKAGRFAAKRRHRAGTHDRRARLRRERLRILGGILLRALPSPLIRIGLGLEYAADYGTFEQK
jgi:hypothetical protein